MRRVYMLRRTLDWVERRRQITSLAIVPLGYTKYSRRFTSSFSEEVEASRNVVRLLEPYQARARKTLGITRFQLSDEFYLDARLPVPPAHTYDGYPQFYDGIGMLRSFLDENALLLERQASKIGEVRRRLEKAGRRALLVCGEAAAGVMGELCRTWQAPLDPFAIRNEYYGGDVNVTGLIVAVDLLEQLPANLEARIVVLPEVMFNFDRVTLDGERRERIVAELERRGALVVVAMPNPRDILEALLARA